MTRDFVSRHNLRPFSSDFDPPWKKVKVCVFPDGDSVSMSVNVPPTTGPETDGTPDLKE